MNPILKIVGTVLTIAARVVKHKVREDEGKTDAKNLKQCYSAPHKKKKSRKKTRNS